MSSSHTDVSPRKTAIIFWPLLVIIIILASEIAVICTLNFPPIRGIVLSAQSWLPFPIAAPVAGLVVGLPSWQRYVMRAQSASVKRGIQVGCLCGIVAHPMREVAEQIELRIGNVEHLDLPDNSVDCCYSAFLIRNLVDLPQGLREMLRVVRPNGHVVCLEISHPSNNLLRKVFYKYFYTCTPFFSTLLGQKLQPNYLAQSLKKFHNAPELKETMESCGWHDVHYIHLTGGIVTLHIGMKWADRTS